MTNVGSWRAPFRFLRMARDHEPNDQLCVAYATQSWYWPRAVHGKPPSAFCACIGTMNHVIGAPNSRSARYCPRHTTPNWSSALRFMEAPFRVHSRFRTLLACDM